MRREAIIHALLGAVWVGSSSAALADSYVVGDRSFVPTMLIEDPFVADEISTTATRLDDHGGNLIPPARENDFGWEFAKRLTPDFAVEVEQGYSMLAGGGQRRLSGFDNLEAALKYQIYANDPHEFLLSLGVAREFGGTGAAALSDPISVTEPQILFGKGMGDLPDSLDFLKPLAVTGLIDYQIPDRHDPLNPQLLEGGFAVSYSLRYLEGNVRYLGLPEFVDRLTPIVEVDYTTPITRAIGIGTVGHVAPGLIYTGDGFDIGAEAVLPITPGAGSGIGIMTMLHFRLDTLFPTTLGRPLWTGSARWE